MTPPFKYSFEMSDRSRGARFLAAFNDIENHLRSLFNAERHTPVSELIRMSRRRLSLTQSQLSSLEAHRELRNAISHERDYDGEPIADPVEAVVADIERLREQIIDPPRVLSVIAAGNVKIAEASDPIDSALKLVRDHDFSQIPIYEEGAYKGLLTTNAVARWLAAQLIEFDGLVERATVKEVLAFAESHEVAKFVPRNLSLMRAVHELAEGGVNGQPLAALIVTDAGNPSQSPLAVIVAEDAFTFRNLLG